MEPFLFGFIIISIINFAYGFSFLNIHNRKNQRLMETKRFNNPSTDISLVPPIPPITILNSGMYHLVVEKPPSVVCHHSGWTGSRSRKKGKEVLEIPMLQRVRDTVGKRVNLVHRLDRGASGALLFTYAENDEESISDAEDIDDLSLSSLMQKTKGPTSAFIQAFASPDAQKTYVALVRGEGICHGEDFKTKGWFPVCRAIRNNHGILKEATTMIRFVAGQGEDDSDKEVLHAEDQDKMNLDRPRLSLVLARPQQGRWHQIRKHLNGLSHPILGDSSHGHSRLNREWRENRGLSYERTCLHLARIQLPPAEPYTTTALDVLSPLPQDMKMILDKYAPEVFERAKPILREEGIVW